MIIFDVTEENIKEHNPYWPQIPDHQYRILTVICVDILWIHFVVGQGKVISCLNLVRIMLETLNLVRKHTSIFSLMSAFFWQK